MTDDIKDQAAHAAQAFRDYGVAATTAAGAALLRGALLVERYAKENMSPNGPSEPGDPPAVDTGRLRASISHRLVEEDAGPSAEIGTNVEYAYWLEFGTSTKAGKPKMLPRPFLMPAFKANAAQVVKIVGEAMKRAGR